MRARQFVGQYLAREDLADGAAVVTIDRAEEHQLSDGDRPKLVLHFDGCEKGLVLNTTNINTLCAIIGTDETEEWKGKQVVLFVDESVTFGGKRVGGIRVRAATREELGQKPAAQRRAASIPSEGANAPIRGNGPAHWPNM